MDDLVEKMLDADSECCAQGDSWRTYCEEDREAFRKGMTAAAKVLLEAALGEPTHEEFVEVFGQDFMALPNTERKICKVIANRKARLLVPKTIESRVELRNETNQLGAYASVWLDGKHVITLLIKDAEIYRKGLIAEMKGKG